MNIVNYILTILRKFYLHYNPKSESLDCSERGIVDASKVSEVITKLILSDKPCMIARFGSNELDAICNYISIDKKDYIAHTPYNYITGKCSEWWWNKTYFKRMFCQAGLFPCNKETIKNFSTIMLEDTKLLDVLGSWRSKENQISQYFPTNMIKVDREKLNPFFADVPWTLALRGKQVLVIHPFAESIKKQYEQKDKLFNRKILPSFKLYVLKAVQSVSGTNNFKDWFDALEYMKKEMDKINYEIVLIGCGAYGFPLAAHAKRMGKKAIHIGGSLQLFFGIKGKRWESEGYKNSQNDYSTLFNDHWIRPSAEETPRTAKDVENSCYW